LANRAASAGAIFAINISLKDDPLEAVEEGVALVANEVEGWKLATLAFIVGLEVTAGVVTVAVEVDDCGAAAKPAVEATCSEDEDETEACAGDTKAVCCAGTGCSLEVPASTFLTAEPLAILPCLADDPLPLDGTEASVRPDTLGVSL
jgi:hypothetical protein